MSKPSITTLERKKGLYLKDTATKGRGVFCTENIKAGEELEVTPSLVLNEAATQKIDETPLVDYAFATGALSKRMQEKARIKKHAHACCMIMGVISFCNHDENPNAEVQWEERGGTLYHILKATKAIPKHTEICTTYGDGWFDER